MSVAPLDHAVVNVRDRMDEAVSVYRRLGFLMTERGYHTLGSINHLAVFTDNYLELIGVEAGVREVRGDILRQPVGLNALVLATEDADATHQALTRSGVAVEVPLSFSRPVEIDGVRRDAKFRTVHLAPGNVPSGRVYFCQHLTRELVWRDAWRLHPNGAVSITRAVIAVAEPRAAAAIFARMFGVGAVQETGAAVTLALPNTRVDFVAAGAVAGMFGDAAPDPGGRRDYMAGLTIATSSLDRAAAALRQGHVATLERDGGLVVPAAAAINLALEFVAR